MYAKGSSSKEGLGSWHFGVHDDAQILPMEPSGLARRSSQNILAGRNSSILHTGKHGTEEPPRNRGGSSRFCKDLPTEVPHSAIIFIHDTTGDASPKHIHYKKKENAVAAFRKLLEDCRDEGWLVDEGCPFDRCMEELYFQHCLPNGNVYTICLDKDREPRENA